MSRERVPSPSGSILPFTQYPAQVSEHFGQAAPPSSPSHLFLPHPHTPGPDPPSSPSHLFIPRPHTPGPDPPSPPQRACHQHMRPQSACWERQALSHTRETELAVPVAENSSTAILRKQMDSRAWEPRAVLRRTVWCESELDWVKEGFLKRGYAAVP